MVGRHAIEEARHFMQAADICEEDGKELLARAAAKMADAVEYRKEAHTIMNGATVAELKEVFDARP